MRVKLSSGICSVFLLAFVTAGCGDGKAHPDTAQSTDRGLLRAADLADRKATPAGYPFTVTLANQLHVSDAATTYQPLNSPTGVAAPGAIGVYATPSTLWLTKRAVGDTVIQLRRVRLGPARGTYGPSVVIPSGLVDGDFATPIADGWTVQAGTVARVARDTQAPSKPKASLRVDGTGGTGGSTPSVTAVYQAVTDLHFHRAGTVYTLDLVARAQKLGRPLAVETKLLYDDGSYDWFLAYPRSRSNGGSGVPAGVPAGSSGWIPLESKAVAKRRVRSMWIYAVDTGTRRLRGSAWVTGFTLTESAH